MSERNINLWTVVGTANTPGTDGKPLGVACALVQLELTRRECDIVARQNTTVADQVLKAILQRTQLGAERAVGAGNSNFLHPDTGKMVEVSLGPDDAIYYGFAGYAASMGRSVCLQFIADPESMVPPKNWTHFALQDDGTYEPRIDEAYLSGPLDEYWRSLIGTDDLDRTVQTYPGYPIDGFMLECPDHFPVSVYEKSISGLATEESAVKMHETEDAVDTRRKAMPSSAASCDAEEGSC